MIPRQRPLGFMVVLALTFALILGAGFNHAAKAASEDVAMFYDDLSQYGEWVDYEKYGPVWRPNQVAEDWRPYTNGRWVPTNEGNVFETEEPWGWATYHYGNWIPTENYGWVWVPGRTWYPSTVEWRTSPETEPVETSYIGWAPTPPPDYVPPPSFAPPSYYSGSPVTDLLTAPLWIFVRAASFLLGFGQPFAPTYTYISQPILVPPAYVPVFFDQTVFVPAYATPTYYPRAYFGGRRLGPGYYNMGPPMRYLSRVSRINQAVITRAINRNSIRIARFHNVVPPRRVMDRHGYVRQILPPALAQGRRLPPPRRASNFRQAQVNLNRPNIVPAPRQVPRITAQIPRVQPGVRARGRELPGTALPARATMPLTPQMTQQIKKLPPKQRFVPGRARPFRPAAAQTGPAQVQPGARAKPGQMTPATRTKTGGPPTGWTRPGEFHPGAGRPAAKPPAARATPGTTKPGAAPLPPGYRGLTPEQRRQQEQEHQRLQRRGASSQAQQQQRQQQQRQQQLRQQQQRQPQQRQQQQRQQQIRQQQQRQQQQRQLQQRQQQQRQLQQRQQQQRQQQIRQQQQRQQQQRQLQQRQQRQRQQQLRQQQQRQLQQRQQRQRQQQIRQQQQRQQQQRQQQIRQQQQRQQQQRQQQMRQQQQRQQQQRQQPRRQPRKQEERE
jgi:hypothetical protein